MEEQFATYEIALELKELGFDGPCLCYYDKNKILCRSLLEYPIINSKNGFHAHWNIIIEPIWQQVIDWFREKQNICINIEPITFDDEPTYIFEIINLKNGMLLNDINSSFIDSSEALE